MKKVTLFPFSKKKSLVLLSFSCFSILCTCSGDKYDLFLYIIGLPLKSKYKKKKKSKYSETVGHEILDFKLILALDETTGNQETGPVGFAGDKEVNTEKRTEHSR